MRNVPWRTALGVLIVIVMVVAGLAVNAARDAHDEAGKATSAAEANSATLKTLRDKEEQAAADRKKLLDGIDLLSKQVRDLGGEPIVTSEDFPEPATEPAGSPSTTTRPRSTTTTTRPRSTTTTTTRPADPPSSPSSTTTTQPQRPPCTTVPVVGSCVPGT